MNDADCFKPWWYFSNFMYITVYDFVAFARFAGMGNLLKVLTREIENYPHFFLDFESKFKQLQDCERIFSLT